MTHRTSFRPARFAAIALIAAAGCGGAMAGAQRQKAWGAADFSCSPRIVGPGDVLVIRKRSSELKEMMVTQPKSKTVHLLVVGSPEPGMQMLMSTEAFASAREVRIPVGTLTGLPWSVGAKQQKVFTVPGIYRITASDTLESDSGDSLDCQVEYRPNKP